MIQPKDAWTIARLLAVEAVNGELQAASERLRPIVDHLASLSLYARQGAWDAYLAAQVDRNEIVMALTEIDPEGPAPEPDEGDDDEWGPIRLGSLPPAEPFPLDVLPLPGATTWRKPPPVDRLPGRLRRRGDPGRRLGAYRPFRLPAGQARLLRVGLDLRRLSWEARRAASLPRSALRWPRCGPSPTILYQSSGRAEMERGRDGARGPRGTTRPRESIVTTDPTTEALAPILAKNPRGLTVAPDEMTKWVMSMDQYKGGKGGDRPFYLSAWEGEPVYIDRAKNMREPIAVPHPFLTVIGGLTPDMLSVSDRGERPRRRVHGPAAVLLSLSRRRRRYSEEGIPDDVADEWKRLANRLVDRAMRRRRTASRPHMWSG